MGFRVLAASHDRRVALGQRRALGLVDEVERRAPDDAGARGMAEVPERGGVDVNEAPVAVDEDGVRQLLDERAKASLGATQLGERARTFDRVADRALERAHGELVLHHVVRPAGAENLDVGLAGVVAGEDDDWNDASAPARFAKELEPGALTEAEIEKTYVGAARTEKDSEPGFERNRVRQQGVVVRELTNDVADEDEIVGIVVDHQDAEDGPLRVGGIRHGAPAR